MKMPNLTRRWARWGVSWHAWFAPAPPLVVVLALYSFFSNWLLNNCMYKVACKMDFLCFENLKHGSWELFHFVLEILEIVEELKEH